MKPRRYDDYLSDAEAPRQRLVFAPDNCLSGQRIVALNDIVAPRTNFIPVTDDSMSGIFIPRGSFAAVRSKDRYHDGDIVYLSFEDEYHIRQFARIGNEVFLKPCNPGYKPIVVTPDRASSLLIHGEVEFSFKIHCALDSERAKILRTLLRQLS